MRPDTIGREIKHEWSDADKINMGNSLALMLVELENVQTEKKVSDTGYNKKITELKSETGALSRKMEKGYSIETVTCDIRYNDPTPKKKSFYRIDTSQHVATEDMTWEECQEEIQFNLPKDGQPAPAPDDEVEVPCKTEKEAREYVPPADRVVARIEPHGKRWIVFLKPAPKTETSEPQVGVIDESLCTCHNVLKANCPDNHPGAKPKKKGN